VDAHIQRGEHVGLRAADARADESGDVPSQRCSRSMVAECHSRATGSLGTGRVRIPAYITRPAVGALVAALVVRSAARVRLGESASSSPRIRRSEAVLPLIRAAMDASGGIVSHALGMCRATSPSAKL
jgi:hypothetical protein